MSDLHPRLAESNLFGSLDAQEFGALAGRFGVRRLASEEILFQRGEPGGVLYLIQRGRVRVFLETNVGETVVLSESSVGDVLGEIALFDGGPRTASAVALVETELLTLSREDLLSFLVEHPQAALTLLGEMGRRLRKTDELLQTCVTRNPNETQTEQMTFGERIADRVASFGGSWTFIIFFGLLLFVWMAINIFILVSRPFDPYPFILLNLVLSTLAALQAPVIMMSQNRQSAKDRLKADLDYAINLKSELEVANLHVKVDRIFELLQTLRPNGKTSESMTGDRHPTNPTESQ